MTPTVFFIAVGIALVIFVWNLWALLKYRSACNDLRWANTRNKREAETLRSEVATLQAAKESAQGEHEAAEMELTKALRERDEANELASANAASGVKIESELGDKLEVVEADLAKALQREASAQAEEERRNVIIILVKKSGRGRYRLHFIGARTGKTYAISTGGWVDKLEAQQTADYLAESRYRVET